MNSKNKILYINDWINNYVVNMLNPAKSLVIGVSGGIDSSVSSTLSAMTGLKTIVLSMPIKQKSSQHDLSLKHQEWLVKNFNNVEAHTLKLDNVPSNVSNNLSKFSVCVSTLLKFLPSHSWCFKLKSCCDDFCLIGIDKTIVFIPVIALNVLDTEESIPPEIPITKD